MRTKGRWRIDWRWFAPGLGVKRWLVMLGLGITILALGAAYILRDIYQFWTFPPFVYYLTLQFIPRWIRGLLFGGLGIGMVTIALIQLGHSLLSPFIRPGQEDVVEVMYRHRRREHGPRIVGIGGGHGLSTLLRGLKEHTSAITAIVTVADDGGSSGRLRRSLGVLPPGDFRNCIVALADDEDLLTQLFQYRFSKGSELNGHSLGNLFIAAMAEITGSFERALAESARVLAVQGRILPSTLENVTLCADLAGEQVAGESEIPKAKLPIERVYLRPDRVRAYPEAIRAILQAEMIVAGPGSLYTSVLPNLLVEDLVEAIRASKAIKVYVCNVATQPGETDGYTLGDHVAAIERHVGPGIFPIVLGNATLPTQLRPGVEPVRPVYPPSATYRVILADLLDTEHPWRHDPHKLAKALMEIYEEERRHGR